MKGALPPSSRLNFFNEELDCCIKSLPTRVEPVKEILRTTFEVHKCRPIFGVFSSAVTMFMTPFGTPARSARTVKALAVNGVSPAVFTTTVQPAARAGPSFLVTIAAGKFHLVGENHQQSAMLVFLRRLTEQSSRILLLAPSRLKLETPVHCEESHRHICELPPQNTIRESCLRNPLRHTNPLWTFRSPSRSFLQDHLGSPESIHTIAGVSLSVHVQSENATKAVLLLHSQLLFEHHRRQTLDMFRSTMKWLGLRRAVAKVSRDVGTC